jgi:signal transduction histidine kinase
MPPPLAVAAAALVLGGFALLAAAVWAWGVVALLAAAVLVLVRGRVDRRTVVEMRLRAGTMRESVTVRSRGQVEVFRARRELAELEAERGRLFHELGRAVYEEDEAGKQAARTAVAAVIERIETKETEIATLIRETEERVRRVQATEVRDEQPPEPARVPEPWPPPDEGDIPEPPQPGPGEPTPGPSEPAPPLEPPVPGPSGDRR